MKTSATHPLRIDAVDLPDGGRLGMTFCPGKQDSNSYWGPLDRDLQVDLAVVRDWGATALVTLLEDHEFGLLKVPDLGDQAEALGLEWHSLPIRDVDVPDDRFERAWVYSGHRLRNHLLAGRSIVLHCRGGIGRTGTIAARMLVELGILGPEEAILAVRAARPRTIETWAQEFHVREATQLTGDPVLTGRILGCLFGGAVGDGFGYAVEFKRLDAIRREFGPDGIRIPQFVSGKLVVSDDTQMTLFTAEGLLSGVNKGTADPAAILEGIRRATLDWYLTQTGRYPGRAACTGLLKHGSLWKRQAPGNTCLSACSGGAGGTPESSINDSKGRGGIMRVAPIGLCRMLTSAQAFEIAARAAAQTHGHPSGFISAGVLAFVVREALDGAEPARSVSKALAHALKWTGHEETVDVVSRALELATKPGSDHDAALKAIGAGWVGEQAFGVALYSVLKGKDFAEVIRIAANHDGDSDSTASVAGQLYGAWKGLADVPHAWIRRLDVLDPLLEIAEGTIRSAVSGERVAG